MLKDSKALELSCYVIGAGAFSIFVRWMQLQLAYNEEQLVDPSFWNVMIVVLVLASAFMFYRFVKQFRDAYMYLPDSFCDALENKGPFYSIACYACGILMILGALVLFMTSETDKNRIFMIILSILGVGTGISFIFLLKSANKPHASSKAFSTFLSTIPIVFWAFWLLLCYKENSINPVVWDFIPEVAGLIVAMLAFFRLAGFAYEIRSDWKCMFLCQLASMLCFMQLADERNFGEQIMFAAAALMLILLNWIMISNLRQGTKEVYADVDESGFEYLPR